MLKSFLHKKLIKNGLFLEYKYLGFGNNQLFNLQKRHFRINLDKLTNKRKIVFISFGSFLGGYACYKIFKNQNSTLIKEIDLIDEHDSNRKNDFKTSFAGNLLPISLLDNIKITKTLPGKELKGKRLILFQYQNCPFCCKVRTFLEFYGLKYDLVEVNPVFRQQLKFTNYRKVPILLIEDETLKKEKQVLLQLIDSSVIISILGTYFLSNKEEDLISILKNYQKISQIVNKKEVSFIPNKYFLMFGEKFQKVKTSETDLMKEREWRKWTDEALVHSLSPNIYRTINESLQAFNHFSKVSDWEKIFSSLERLIVIYTGAFAMYFVGKHLKKKYNIKEDVRESLYDNCKYFLNKKGKDNFIGGSSPNLADLSVYGVLNSIEGCDAFNDLLKHTQISNWYFSMQNKVQNHDGIQYLKY